MGTKVYPASPFPMSPLALRIFAIARAEGTQARIVGGAVRDWLMGRPIGDIDMAIALPIETAATAFRDAGLRVIDTGLAHGTVTVLDPADPDHGAHPDPESGRVTSQHAIEVTQTRVDVATDGRHAVVAYSHDWAADAARRDFTINAIYLDESQKLDDPLGGWADMQAGTLRFAGKADARVREDALRMLRYCRFLPLFGSAGIDDAAAAALRTHAPLATGLSGERVQHEVMRICAAAGAQAAFAFMQNTGVAPAAIGVDLYPENLNFLPPYDALEDAVLDGSGLWVFMLSTMIPDGTATAVAAQLRLSRKQARLLSGLETSAIDAAVGPALEGDSWQQTAWFLNQAGHDAGLCYGRWMARQQRQADVAHIAELSRWTPPSCPVSGADLLSQGVDKGPALGQMLAKIEALWVHSGFTLSKAALLADIA